jgi:hypothetical protein
MLSLSEYVLWSNDWNRNVVTLSSKAGGLPDAYVDNTLCFARASKDYKETISSFLHPLEWLRFAFGKDEKYDRLVTIYFMYDKLAFMQDAWNYKFIQRDGTVITLEKWNV